MPLEPTAAPVVRQFREHVAGLSGRQLGAIKTAAIRSGLSLDEYIDRVDSGLKRCISCKAWKDVSGFRVDQSRWDGFAAQCDECHNAGHRLKYIPVPPDQRKPMGTPRHDPCDGDKAQANRLINLDVRSGKRPSPNDLYCAHCGHKGPDRRHEYHHHMGYAARHHYDVIALCSKCHRREHPRCRRRPQ